MSNYRYQPKDSSGGCLSCTLVLAICLAAESFVAWIFQMLWNFIVPDLFGLPVINFWQALAIWLLVGLIGGCFKAIISNK